MVLRTVEALSAAHMLMTYSRCILDAVSHPSVWLLQRGRNRQPERMFSISGLKCVSIRFIKIFRDDVVRFMSMHLESSSLAAHIPVVFS